MATIADEWNRVVNRVEDLKQFDPFGRMASTVAATLELIDKLRADPRLHDVHPNLTHATVSLRYTDIPRYVMVGFVPEADDRFELFFVDDPSLELSEVRDVSRAEVVDAVVEYLERLKPVAVG
jgi:hypothetical protein